MLCSMMPVDTLAAIANVIADRLNFDDYYWGFDIPDGLKDALAACCGHGRYFTQAIYKELYFLNAQAVREDGGEVDLSAPDINVEEYVIHQKKKDNDCVQPWHYQFVKLLNHYVLQTEWGTTRKNPLRLGIKELIFNLYAFIVLHSPQFAEFEWGTLGRTLDINKASKVCI